MSAYNGLTMAAVFYDGSSSNPVAPFTPVSLGTAAEMATAIAAGLRLKSGNLVVPVSVATVGGITTGDRRVIGVTLGPSNPKTGEVTVVVAGIAEVWANAAILVNKLLHVVAATTRTSAQTPFTSLEEALIPTDPNLTRTYNLGLVDDAAISDQSSSANLTYYPVGISLKAATAQYDVIPVLLQQGEIHA